MLQIRDLVVRLGGRAVLEDASATVPAGHRVGLIGRNGAGKSTLMRTILGEITPDAGSIDLPQGARVATVAQELPDPSRTPLEHVLAADREREALLATAHDERDPAAQAEAWARLETLGAAALPARAAQVLAGLGFDEAAQGRPLGSFSGGWRMRAALAAALVLDADLLLLDEPTNHLDLESRLWLECFLARHPATLVVTSHDRQLLNRVCDSILHVDAGRLAFYRGDYDTFERTRRERLAQQEIERRNIEVRRAHLQSFVDRFRAKATKARQAQSRLKAIARLKDVPPLPVEPDTTFHLPDPEPLPSPILTVNGASAGYDGKPVLRRLDLVVAQDDRIALLGVNGAGKSTLLRLIEGGLAPLAGEVVRAPKLRVAYLRQEQAEAFDPDETPVIALGRIMPDAPEEKVRTQLGRFGFGQDRATTPIGVLSGGEKARLLFACATRHAPHLLLLDEPTNHLDIQAREALMESIAGYAGAVLIVTHDPALVEATADRLWLVEGGGCSVYDGDVGDYARAVLAQRQPTGGGNVEEKREKRRVAAEKRAALGPLRKAATDAEREHEKLTRALAKLDAELADPALYAAGGEAVAARQRRRADLVRALDAAETAWLEAQEALEAAG